MPAYLPSIALTVGRVRLEWGLALGFLAVIVKIDREPASAKRPSRRAAEEGKVRLPLRYLAFCRSGG